MYLASPVPQISISPAPPDELPVEPYSPFSSTTVTSDDKDSYRPQHLTPPPTHTKFGKPLSPLRPSEAPFTGQGLERDRFEALLKASRERNAVVRAKKVQDLRKEIALKTHKNKQMERRALFLSKVLAPPSPTAVSTPKTPPDSPAIFHYSLPSPGLVSPLAMFESLTDDSACGSVTYSRQPWVEQVDFRLPDNIRAKQSSFKDSSAASAKPIPSLDQILARLSYQRHVRASSVGEDVGGARLSEPSYKILRERPKLSIGVGRLQMVRASKPLKAEESLISPPSSPLSPVLQVTTLRVPCSSKSSPTELSESNVNALDARERSARDMLSALRRRTLPSECALSGHDDVGDVEERKWKRNSCPAEILPKGRSASDHPVLSLPGGF